MRAIAVVLFAMALASVAAASTVEYGPLHTTGINQDGYPVFQMVCSSDRCVGLRGKELGSPKQVAVYMPAIVTSEIERLHYACAILCYDRDYNIVGKPSPNYHNPYARP
jgi:hypothetical protein